LFKDKSEFSELLKSKHSEVVKCNELIIELNSKIQQLELSLFHKDLILIDIKAKSKQPGGRDLCLDR